jgi:aminoglycoside phosphotransferase (APT) family kinase protein
VVTHGDACLPNLIQNRGSFVGFVDCAMLGVADRCQDLALASLSMRSNLGDPWAERFLELYGSSTPEADKLDYYSLLDEFFWSLIAETDAMTRDLETFLANDEIAHGLRRYMAIIPGTLL